MTDPAASPDVRRRLPPVGALLLHDATRPLLTRYGHHAVVAALRETLAALRASPPDAHPADADLSGTVLDGAAVRLAARFRPTLRPVINATGVIIHTNLGRAPLSDAAQAAIIDAARGYTTLEYDLDRGKRGSRALHAERALRDVTGAEAALVVNNNAAALLLLLSALARGREVIISRGQLVEIGGGFRIPDVMAQSGARLVEVGTTNRTRIRDYERAFTPDTALILRAHYSNFRQIGFVETADLRDMAALAHSRGVLLVDDVGSGALLDTAAHGLAHEPTVQDSLAAGADLVAFSGDKLLGAPQAGIIVGRKPLVETLRAHPLARAVRIDKLSLAGLSATLDAYRRGTALEHVPVWQMIARLLDALRAEAAAWAAAWGGTVIDGTSTVGGGSLPGETLPTALAALDVASPDQFMARLRALDTPIIARILRDRVVFDPRTVLAGQSEALVAGVQAALADDGRNGLK